MSRFPDGGNDWDGKVDELRRVRAAAAAGDTRFHFHMLVRHISNLIGRPGRSWGYPHSRDTYLSGIRWVFKVMAKPRPVVVSGPSGAGKSTLLKLLLEEYDQVFGFSVSHTTRNPRRGEENGRDYYFVSREEMLHGIDAGEFIENAEFSGNIYGTSKKAVQEVQARNQICILDIDMQGVRNIKKTDLCPIYISIQPPSFEILEQRLRQRKTETEESLQKRLAAAKLDMEFSKEPGIFDEVLINDVLEDTYIRLRSVLSEEIQRVRALQN